MNKDEWLVAMMLNNAGVPCSSVIARMICAQMTNSDAPDVSEDIYDNEFPIEWNTIDVSKSGNFTYIYDGSQIVKISNIVPTAKKMESTVLVLEDTMEIPYSTTYSVGDFIVYLYANSDTEVALIASDGTPCESGLYTLDYSVNGIDANFSLRTTI